MNLDRSTIKAISADTRLKMLKMLLKRKKMPSEISREIGLSPSTVVGHLQNLESAGLIKRVETGHKWVYYELTERGLGIVNPRAPGQLTLALMAGILMALFGAFKSINSESALLGAEKSVIEESIKEVPMAAQNAADMGTQAVATAASGSWIWLAVIAAGLVLAAFSIYLMRKRKPEQFIS